MKLEIDKGFLEWYDSLNREDQISVHSFLAKRTKPAPYYLRCEPSVGKVFEVMTKLKELGLDNVQPYREGNWIKWKFLSLAERNKVLLTHCFGKED